MWIIAIASPNVLGDDIQGFSVVEMRASSVDLDVIERYKTTSPIVFNEYKAIQKCAKRYNIPTDGVKIFIHSNPSKIFQFLSEHTELDEIPLDGPSALATHVMVYLYQTDPCLIHNMIVGLLDRLQDTSWPCQLPLHNHHLLRAAFFILLNKDKVLKQSALKGYPPSITQLDRRKAAAFFIALEDESIQPFLSNESTGT